MALKVLAQSTEGSLRHTKLAPNSRYRIRNVFNINDRLDNKAPYYSHCSYCAFESPDTTSSNRPRNSSIRLPSFSISSWFWILITALASFESSCAASTLSSSSPRGAVSCSWFRFISFARKTAKSLNMSDMASVGTLDFFDDIFELEGLDNWKGLDTTLVQYHAHD